MPQRKRWVLVEISCHPVNKKTSISLRLNQKEINAMNSSENAEPTASDANPITRRDFMKKSALSAGALTMLTKGIGLAQESSYQPPPPPPPCPGTCGRFVPNVDGKVYVDVSLPDSDTKKYFIKGQCECKYHETEAWEAALPPGNDDPPAWPEEGKGGLSHHEANGHRIHS
jgi:hypothetical protein